MRRSSALWVVPPLVLGIAAAIWFIRQAPEPGRTDARPPSLAVRVSQLQPREIAPLARGWGDVRAAETWTAVSEVKGQIIWRHPDLEAGKLISAGTKVLEIDAADYKLAIVQAEADLAAYAAESALIDAEADNTARVLALEEARLAISEADLERNRKLLSQGVTAQTRVDEAERTALLARRTVVEQKNALALIGPRRDRVAAQIARTEATLARARRDLDHTAITAPFDLRVTSVPAELFEYVNIGKTLVTGDGVDRVEVVAQLPLDSFRRLLYGTDDIKDTLAAIGLGPGGRFHAEIRLVSDPAQVWQGNVTRIESALDARARTVPVVVMIDAPYGKANPPLRPPLLPNMQVEVTLTGHPLSGLIVIPEAALHGELVYLTDPDGQLELRPVTEAFRQDGLVVIDGGLKPGDLLVLDDVAPAIPGMLLQPMEVTQ